MTSKKLETILAEVRRRKEQNKEDWMKPIVMQYKQSKEINYTNAQQEVFNRFIDTYSRLRSTGDSKNRSVAKALYITGAHHADTQRDLYE